MSSSTEAQVHQQKLSSHTPKQLAIYIRLLDATDAKADWKEIAAVVLGLDVIGDPEGALTAFKDAVEHANWLRDHGYLLLAKAAQT